MKKIFLPLFVISLALSLSCTRKQAALFSPSSSRSPEDTVKQFLDISAQAKSKDDRKRLQELCQGDLRRAFERMNDEAFQLIYLDSRVTILEMKILESKTESDAATIGYQVTVDNQQGTDRTKEINQREVELKRTNGTWLISSIRVKGTDQIAFTKGMFF